MLKKLAENWSLFWTLQTIGWAGYMLDRYLSAEGRFFPVYFIYLVIACALTFALRPVYHRVWRRKPNVLTIGATIVVCSIAAAFLWLVLGEIVFAILGIRRFPVPEKQSLIAYLSDTFVVSLQHHKPFLFLSWSALYFGIKYWQSKQAEEENALKSQALAREAELKMLRYQINPHFLFNSLNSASALVHESPAKTEKMINELSDFLRYSLAGGKNERATLGDEIEAVRNYLNIEQVRFEDKLKVNFDIAPETLNFPLPSFLLHPLVENAVKYGMKTSDLPLRIEIKSRCSEENGALHIEISNTGKWCASPNEFDHNGSSTRIGLENVRKRLAQSFPNRSNFAVREDDGRIVARLEIKPIGKQKLSNN